MGRRTSCPEAYASELSLIIEFLMCESLETTSEVADDQENMNNFFE